ncbi:MAG TPA: hypothetical protein VK196_06680 [Magnetospirillum sp.]|nr:hypothetical protein [Magnetospirillum sp.]
MPQPSDNERQRAAELGISFDGRHYHYREFRYDRLADALACARQDRSKGAHPPRGETSQWAAPMEPTDAERRQMAEFGITFDGTAFHYGPYRYDTLADACNYARLKRST